MKFVLFKEGLFYLAWEGGYLTGKFGTTVSHFKSLNTDENKFGVKIINIELLQEVPKFCKMKKIFHSFIPSFM